MKSLTAPLDPLSKTRHILSKLVRLSLALYLILSLGLPGSGICRGQSQFDPSLPGDVQVETGEPDSKFDSDNMEMDDISREPSRSNEPGQSKESARKSLFTTFVESVWTLGYRASHRTGDDPKLINNHIFLRQEMETLISETYFFKLDWKASGYPKTDHRAEAKDKKFYLEADLREAYLQAGYDNLSIKLGNQINVWGKADTMAVTDVVSPRDASEFIFSKIEDARFGQWMLSSNIYHDNSSLFVFLSPLAETDKYPGVGTHYFLPPGSENFQIVDDSPEFGEMEAGLKTDHLFSKTEISVMTGHFHANAPVYETRGYTVHETYLAYNMVGTAISHAFEPVLIKLELAFKQGFPLQGMDAKGFYLSMESDIMDGAAGIEYNANDAYFMSLELSNRHIFSDRTSLIQGRRDSTSLYYTLTKDFWHKTLALEYNFYYHIQDQNRFHNFQATYDLTDAIEIRARYTLLNVTDTQSLMWAYKDEDRAALEIRYFF